MSCRWLMPGFLLWMGCSGRPVPSGSLDQEREQILVLRCLEGEVIGYITLDSDDEVETDGLPPGAIAVQLDSMPPCDPTES